MRTLLTLLTFIPFISFSQIDFVWTDSLDGDFSFTEQWSYEEGIYVNKWGQLSCDGFCPIEIDRMKDDQGRIYDDSLTSFYSYVDTTHHYFTHEGTVKAFEFHECNYATASHSFGKIHIQTEMNIATHTSLHIVFDPKKSFEEGSYKVYLIYNSIRRVKPVVFLAESGSIKLSESDYNKGMIKMSFDLKFEEVSNNPDFKQSWKGKILTKL